MNDDFINLFEKPKPPRSEFTAALYQKITQPVKTTPRTYLLRYVALSIAMVAMVLTVWFFSPSARAFADSIIHQFTKGGALIQTTTDAAQASHLAGFTVLAPAYLPTGYVISNQPGAWTVVHDQGGVMVDISYEKNSTATYLSISEQKNWPAELGTLINLPGKQDVTVRGQPGVWIPNNGKNILTWEENGIRYIIVTHISSKDEALKIAESLVK